LQQLPQARLMASESGRTTRRRSPRLSRMMSGFVWMSRKQKLSSAVTTRWWINITSSKMDRRPRVKSCFTQWWRILTAADWGSMMSTGEIPPIMSGTRRLIH